MPFPSLLGRSAVQLCRPCVACDGFRTTLHGFHFPLARLKSAIAAIVITRSGVACLVVKPIDESCLATMKVSSDAPGRATGVSQTTETTGKEGSGPPFLGTYCLLKTTTSLWAAPFGSVTLVDTVSTVP